MHLTLSIAKLQIRFDKYENEFFLGLLFVCYISLTVPYADCFVALVARSQPSALQATVAC